jgi:hypothetical protein
MPYLEINKKIRPQVCMKTMEVFNGFYTESQFNLIKDIFITYHNRGGVLPFVDFAMIPIKKDVGDIEKERSEWCRYIRGKLANDWRVILKI